MISDESDSAPARRQDMRPGDFGFPELTLIWQLPGREIHCSIGDILGNVSRFSNIPSNVVLGGCCRNMICVGLNDRLNLQFEHSVLLITSGAVVGRVPPSRFCQLFTLQLLLPEALNAALYLGVAMGPGNLPAVRFLAGGSVWLGSKQCQ